MKSMFKFLILFSVFSCLQNQEVKTLDREEFSISYPSYLELDESGEEETVFVLKTPQKGEDDIFIENINLATKEAGNTQFNEFAIQTEREISSFAEIVESKRLKLNDKNCLRLVFKLIQNDVELTFIQHLFVENQKVYALTFSSESKVYDDYYNEMNDVLMSFKIK